MAHVTQRFPHAVLRENVQEGRLIGNASPTARLDVTGQSGSAAQNAPTVLKVAGGFGGKFLSGGYGSAGAGGALQLTSGIGGTASFILFPYLPRATGGTGAAILMTGGGRGKVVYPQTFVPADGSSVILQPGAGGSGTNSSGLPGNVILAPTRGKVGIRTATPTARTLDVGAGGTTLADAWITRSSRRFKTNIQPVEGALEKVEHLQGVPYQPPQQPYQLDIPATLVLQPSRGADSP